MCGWGDSGCCAMTKYDILEARVSRLEILALEEIKMVTVCWCSYLKRKENMDDVEIDHLSGCQRIIGTYYNQQRKAFGHCVRVFPDNICTFYILHAKQN